MRGAFYIHNSHIEEPPSSNESNWRKWFRFWFLVYIKYSQDNGQCQKQRSALNESLSEMLMEPFFLYGWRSSNIREGSLLSPVVSALVWIRCSLKQTPRNAATRYVSFSVKVDTILVYSYLCVCFSWHRLIQLHVKVLRYRDTRGSKSRLLDPEILVIVKRGSFRVAKGVFRRNYTASTCYPSSWGFVMQTCFSGHFDRLTFVLLKNAVFWDMALCRCCKNRRVGVLVVC
jgi:hypothetical protein